MAYATIRTELHDIDPKKYTLFQWKDAAKHLTGNDVDLDNLILQQNTTTEFSLRDDL